MRMKTQRVRGRMGQTDSGARFILIFGNYFNVDVDVSGFYA